MSSNVFDHPFLSGLLGEPQMASLFTVEKDIACMMQFEIALAIAQAELGVIPKSSASDIKNAVTTFKPDMNDLNIATARDGVCVPALIGQLRAHIGGEAANYLHHGATSQDVIDTSLMMRLKSGVGQLGSQLEQITAAFDKLATKFGNNTLTARTRMQNASLTNVRRQIETWQSPLVKLHTHLSVVTRDISILQLGGAIGDGAGLGEHYQQLCKATAKTLGLTAPPSAWHTERIGLVGLANWLSQLTTGLGKIGQDICLMRMNDNDEIKLSGTGGSSAMPHKQNPIKAEVLVTLARFNATQISGIHHAAIHENNRSGAAWTLEWMVLPQMMMATAASLRTANSLLNSIEEFGKS